MAESISLKIDDKIDGNVMNIMKNNNNNNTKTFDDETNNIIIVDNNHNHQQPDKMNNGGDHYSSNENGQQQPEQNDDKDEQNNHNDNDDNHYEQPINYSPRISLPLTETKTMEDDEDIIVNLRARIYRYDTNNGDEEPEFKERGTGTVKILQHKQTGMYRILMRREKTFKICANHYITGSMKLNKHNNSEKVFLYSTLADFYENESNPETFAIRFSNAENASIFKEAFDEAVEFMIEQESDDKEESIVTTTANTAAADDNQEETTTNELANEIEKIHLNQNEQQQSKPKPSNDDDENSI